MRNAILFHLLTIKQMEFEIIAVDPFQMIFDLNAHLYLEQVINKTIK